MNKNQKTYRKFQTEPKQRSRTERPPAATSQQSTLLRSPRRPRWRLRWTAADTKHPAGRWTWSNKGSSLVKENNHRSEKLLFRGFCVNVTLHKPLRPAMDSKWHEHMHREPFGQDGEEGSSDQGMSQADRYLKRKALEAVGSWVFSPWSWLKAQKPVGKL